MNRPIGEHAAAIAQLSSDLQVPVHEIEKVYRAQLDRICKSARIPHYLAVLTTRNTRSIVRKSRENPQDLH